MEKAGFFFHFFHLNSEQLVLISHFIYLVSEISISDEVQIIPELIIVQSVLQIQYSGSVGLFVLTKTMIETLLAHHR